MKILQIITKSELGGAQSVLVNIVNSLCKEHDVTVVAGEGDRQMFEAIDSRVRIIHCPHLQRAISLYHDTKALFFLRNVSKELQPDVIHLHSSKAGLLGRLAFPKQHIVYTVHGFDSVRVAHRFLLPIERMMQNRCAKIIGVSSYDAKNLRIEGITHGVSTVINGIIPPDDRQGQKLPVPDKYKKKILCVARVSKQKRLSTFLDVAARLPEHAFVWIGNLEHVPCTLPNVFFMGSIPNANEYNYDADLFILPTNYEGLPMTIIEAMSYGKPVVASDVGGISEIVRDGENGFLVENSTEAFVEKISLILNDDQLCRRMSERSLAIFRDELTAERMVAKYLKIYQDIATSGNK